MIRKIKGTLLLLMVVPLLAQTQQKPHKYWVHFQDKAHSPYSLQKPNEFLSQRAIDRRDQQNIRLAKNDLPVSPTYLDSLKKMDLPVHFTSKWLNGASLTIKDSQKVRSIQQYSFVQNIKLIKEGSLETNAIQRFPSLIPFEYGRTLKQVEQLNGHLLHKQGHLGAQKYIAVLDAGFNQVNSLKGFRFLREFEQIKLTRDFYNDKKAFYSNSTHGMYVLSQMGGFIDGAFAGTAPQSSYLLIRSENPNSEFIQEEYAWVAAAELADSAGVDIINSSLGYTDFEDSTMNHAYQDLDGNTTPITRAADIAASKGILVVSSAGNKGNDPWQYITAPADADSILTVGAVDKSGNYAEFSSKGPTYDGRLKPEVVAMGHNNYLIADQEGSFIQGSGTSFSAPMIAGMAGSLWSAFPKAQNMQVREAIIKSGSQYKNPDTLRGYGIPDFYKAFTILDQEINNVAPSTKHLATYPNPFTKQINVDIFNKSGSYADVILSDMTGKSIINKKVQLVNNTTTTLKMDNLEDLRPGMYMLKVIVDGRTFIKKIIKNTNR